MVRAAAGSAIMIILSLCDLSSLAFSPLDACETKGFPNSLSTGGNTYKVADARDCVNGFRINLHDMLITLENMYFGHSTIYSFTDIARNSTSSVESNKCGLKVHNVTVDVKAGLHEIHTDLVQPELRKQGLDDSAPALGELTASELYARLSAPSDVAAFSFHSRLRSLLSTLQDAHTLYTFNTAIFQVLPVKFSAEPCTKDGDAKFQVRAAPANRAVDLFNLHGRTQVLSSGTDKVVQSIDGKDPVEYLQRIGDGVGNVHDKGQRFNAVLLSELIGGCDGICGVLGANMDMVEAGHESPEFCFADGSCQIVDWVLSYESTTVDAIFAEKDKDYMTLQGMESEKAKWEQERALACAAIPACAKQFPPSEQAPRFSMSATRAYRRGLGSRIPNRVLQDAALLFAQATAASSVASGIAERVLKEPPAKIELRTHSDAGTFSHAKAKAPTEFCYGGQPQGSHVVQTCCYKGLYQGFQEFVTASILGDMAVFKLTSMGSDTSSFGAAAHAWAKLSARSQLAGVKRVLIDLVGNGGGLVALSDFLQSLFLKEYEPKNLCSFYNKRIAPYWKEWIDSFGQGLDASVKQHLESLRQLATNQTVDVVQWYAKFQFRYLKGILRASNSILGEAFQCQFRQGQCKGVVTIDLSIVDELIARTNAATSVEDVVDIAEQELPKRAFVPTILLGISEADAASGWFPFKGLDVLDPATLKPYPNMSGAREPEVQQWGGVESHYSKRGFLSACSVASDEGLKELVRSGFLIQATADEVKAARDHPWEQIAFVTDGNAGSAGSSFPSKLMASGYGTAFTYGGRQDADGMDTSAFAGGSVTEYAQWWPQVAAAAELGMWLLPNSSWERYSRSVHSTMFSDVDSPLYPYPMPLQAASSRFNFNIMYLREVSDATSLPRQYYRMPAHKHYEQWPEKLHRTCDNTDGLLRLYRAINEEDWWALRQAPEYLHNGWGGACLPNATQKCLPPGCSSPTFKVAVPFPGPGLFPSVGTCGHSSDSSDDDDDDAGLIIWIVVAIVASVIAIALGVWCVKFRGKVNPSGTEQSDDLPLAEVGNS
eukprot:TRINITY_DN5429_c0_g1_i1.p1 TRINITY_DN5429_c0_g1~~TRINITY_DN5429_c0_g1_i1.p1  ORF type:complete len:1075 (-),score=183.40 TRINITY_DN5429_c0_g1_i1:105-3272(-)